MNFFPDGCQELAKGQQTLLDLVLCQLIFTALDLYPPDVVIRAVLVRNRLHSPNPQDFAGNIVNVFGSWGFSFQVEEFDSNQIIDVGLVF